MESVVVANAAASGCRLLLQGLNFSHQDFIGIVGFPELVLNTLELLEENFTVPFVYSIASMSQGCKPTPKEVCE